MYERVFTQYLWLIVVREVGVLQHASLSSIGAKHRLDLAHQTCPDIELQRRDNGRNSGVL